jgi:CheY-like chemotaxis protein
MTPKRIIFVEDDAILSLATCETIGKFGYEVDSVCSGSAAIDAIRHGDYSAIVTDINLGAGPDGFQVAGYARKLRPDIPVVYVSGTHGAQHAACGVRGSVFIAKPFHAHQILAALSQLIHLEAA